MANIFTLLIAIATLITGILWCLQYFKLDLFSCRMAKQHYNVTVINDNNVIDKMKKPTLIENCASLFPVLLLVFIIRSFIVEPFKIPSGSMMPSILIGDFILVEKFAYGIKNPITNTTWIETSHPQRGDIVVFKYPLNPNLNYIKRVVGLPGDKIIYDLVTKRLTVQPNCAIKQDCSKVSSIRTTYRKCVPSTSVQSLNFTNNSKINSTFIDIPRDQPVASGGIRLLQCQEALGSVLHNVLIVPGQQDQLRMYYKQSGSALAEWIVRKGEYFMMGDNRDLSSDSRYWGCVSEKNIIGKATVIWMSLEKKEGQWLKNIRFNRIGSIH